jgi:hypothetical protein
MSNAGRGETLKGQPQRDAKSFGGYSELKLFRKKSWQFPSRSVQRFTIHLTPQAYAKQFAVLKSVDNCGPLTAFDLENCENSYPPITDS